jgi:hypothetical protein
VLEARAVLPADTFAPGPISGQFITGGLRSGPFPGQPVQGISAVLAAEPGSFWVMEDNGYGAKENSADFLLRMYHVTPHWETADGGPGTVYLGSFIQLRDPAHQIPWPIVNGSTAERALTHFEQPGNSLGDLTALDEHRFLMIERDQPGGPAAQFKHVFVLDLRDVGDDGFLVKRDAVDLLDIADPNLISLPARSGDFGLGETFKLPFETIESVLLLDGGRLLVIDDNNYPFSAGRNPSLPDDTEFIVVRAGSLH